MKKNQKMFRGPDGTPWRVEVRAPSASNAMIVFHHPDGATSRFDRYAWVQSNGPGARDVTSRLDRKAVLESLTEDTLASLFRRSMPISTSQPGANLAAG
jgi:hypothetical protein